MVGVNIGMCVLLWDCAPLCFTHLEGNICIPLLLYPYINICIYNLSVFVLSKTIIIFTVYNIYYMFYIKKK